MTSGLLLHKGLADRHCLLHVPTFRSLEAAWQVVSPHVVFDTTVPASHHAITIESFRVGCHVLGEKPMSDALAKARRMMEAA